MVIKDKHEFKMLSYRVLYGTFDRQFNKANKEGVQDERSHSLGFSVVHFEGHAVNTRGLDKKKRVNWGSPPKAEGAPMSVKDDCLQLNGEMIVTKQQCCS